MTSARRRAAPRPRAGTPVLAALAAVLCLAAAGCSGSAAGTDPADTVRIVLPEEPPTLEPCDASLTATGVVVRSNITQPLMERNPTTGALEPLLATSWVQTTPTTWTFHIREGVRFSDGTPFDAAAAASSINRAVNGSFGCNVDGYVFGDTELQVAAPDPTTLTVSTPEPDPILPLRVSFVEMVPTSTNAAGKVRVPIGTGPYRVASWDAGTRLNLERNPDYWGTPPAYAHAEYQWRSDSSVRAAMVVNGEADISTGLGPEDGAGDLAVSYPNNETTALRIQATEPPLNDVRVRQAIGLAIDRNGIISALLNGDGQPAAQLVPEGVIGHDPDLTPVGFDVDRARALVAAARADGVDTTTPIRLITRTGLFPRIEQVVQAIAYQLDLAGLNVQIQMMDTSEALTYQQRPFPANTGPILLVIQHGNQAGDAAFSMDQYLKSEGFQSSYGTPDFDREINAAEALTGDARQAALAKVFVDEPREIAQYAYIAHMRGILARSPSVDYTPNSATGDEMRLAEMTPRTTK
ncbi:ABC transporter substrate-binding protein [Saccharopolyspora sp. 5N708]|uniref:ABC transporter substrate-binding protein n=1 Tax=Saccharopolyspora sp. 5N708 TaxID=3457424 RepID=UPI003FD662C4